MGAFNDVSTQIFHRPEYPTTDFSGKTIIVTGSNVGLGKEAVKHFVRLNAKTVIVAVRSIAKGEAAKAEIEAESGRTGVVEVWELDLSYYASVKTFAKRAASLDCLHAAILNAGIAPQKYETAEDNESAITVNVISNVLLGLLLLPTLRSSAKKWGFEPTLSYVGSGSFTKFAERKTANVIETLNDRETAEMPARYLVSKLIQMFAVEEIAEQTANEKPSVIVNTLRPGLCYTELTRHAEGITAMFVALVLYLLAWTAEEGSRNLVSATTAGPESHGVMMSAAGIKGDILSSFVPSSEGRETQEKIWGEIAIKIEKIQPGLLNEVGLQA